MTESVITLRNGAGHALHCVLETPDGASSGIACVLLSPGVKMRVAPHRLYRKLSGEFLRRGIAVLRVDFHGLGDSEGDLPEAQLDQLYRQVQLGRHVQDVEAAAQFLASRGFSRLVVGGLCGGALTGLLAAARIPQMDALYAIGIPVILDGSGIHVSEVMSQGQLREVRGTYLTKLLRPSAWLRLLTFRSDIRTILRSLFPSARRGRKGGGVTGIPVPEGALAPNLNQEFVRAFFALMAARRRALLLFSGADRLHHEYQEKFAIPWRAAMKDIEGSLAVRVVPGANHVLGRPDWIDAARAETAVWLDEYLRWRP